MDGLDGQVALITGASKGIGAAAALDLARRGVTVGLLARNRQAIESQQAAIAAAGGTALAYCADVADYDAVSAALNDLAGRAGRLDILVNNAGIIDPIGRIAEIEPQAWRRVQEVNVMGVFNGLHAALPIMVGQGAGTIVNISSGAASNALEGWSHYCASKAAVLSLTRSVHKEYADQGIRMFGLSPGTVATDMQRQIKTSGINPVSQMDFDRHIPPQWVASAISWLCHAAEAEPYLGTDFTLKSDEGRKLVGLPV